MITFHHTTQGCLGSNLLCACGRVEASRVRLLLQLCGGNLGETPGSEKKQTNEVNLKGMNNIINFGLQLFSEVFNKLNAAMEEALTLLRKCATMSKLDKMMDQGLSFVNEQKAALPTLQVPTNLVPEGLVKGTEGLMKGLTKTLFGDQGPPSGDTKNHLISILEVLKKGTQEVSICHTSLFSQPFELHIFQSPALSLSPTLLIAC